MSREVEFPADAVLRHAGAVSAASDEVGQARAAAREVTMDSQAYGQLCQFLPALLNPVFDSAAEVMSHAVEAFEETALKLRATASATTSTDAGSAQRLDAAAGPGLELPL